MTAKLKRDGRGRRGLPENDFATMRLRRIPAEASPAPGAVHGRHRRGGRAEPPYEQSPYDEAPSDEAPYGEPPYEESPYDESPYEEDDGHGTPAIPAGTAFRRFWPLSKGLRGRLALVCLCVIIAALAETAAILLFSDLTDNALQRGSLDAFWGPAAKWLGVAVVGAAVGYVGNSLAVGASERFVMRLRAQVFDHVQRMPPHFFQRHRQGDLLARLTGDVEAIEQMIVSGVIGAVSSAFSAVFYAVAAFWLRWDLAVATFVLAPLFWLAAKHFAGSIRSVARDERVADGAITSVVEESLGNIVLTQAYGREDAERARLDREARAWFTASVRGARLSELYERLVEVIETLCVLSVIGLGVWEISAGRMTLGQLLAFAAFLGYLYPPIRDLGQLGLTVTTATAGAERLIELLDARPSVGDPPPGPPQNSPPTPASADPSTTRPPAPPGPAPTVSVHTGPMHPMHPHTPHAPHPPRHGAVP